MTLPRLAPVHRAARRLHPYDDIRALLATPAGHVKDAAAIEMDLEEALREVQEKASRLRSSRGFVGLLIIISAIGVFWLRDWWLDLAGPHAYLLALVRGAHLALMLGALWVTRYEKYGAYGVGFGVLVVSTVCVMTAITEILKGDVGTAPLLFIPLMMFVATLLPWGVRSQYVIVAVATLAVLGNVYAVRGDLSVMFGQGQLAAAIAFATSIYVAYEVDRYRLDVELRNVALRRSEQYFRSLIENASDVITILNREGTVRYESPSVTRLLGHAPAELIGTNVLARVHPDDAARVLEEFQQVLLTDGVVGAIEFRVRHQDGSWRVVHATASNLLADAAVRGVVINAHDITERKQAEEEAQRHLRELEEREDKIRWQAAELAVARDAALEASRTKSAFLANTSHEIRTPMNIIIGMTDIALDGPLDPSTRDCLQRVRAASFGLLTIVNDILDLAKIESGKMVLDTAPFDLRRTIDEVMTLLAPSVTAKRLTLACRVETSVPGAVCGDAVRLRQVLTNLLGNAIKFTESGEVALEVGVVQATPARADVVFTVRDTGIGIPRDQQAAVFESFTQVDRGGNGHVGGTGLGLTISRQLVELMGGALHLESTVGEGSTFWFTLGLDLSPAATAQPPPAAA